MTDLVRAKIVSVSDPTGRGRVRISVPLWAGSGPVWAEAVRPGVAAAAYKIGDIVVAGFEGGDPMHPIVLGALPRP